MKNIVKLFGIIAIVALIGFSFALTFTSCGDEGGPTGGSYNPGGTNNPTGGTGSGAVSGTYRWEYSSDWYITFSNGSFTGYDEGPLTRGTYSINGSTITLSTWFYGRYWTIVDSNTVKDDDGHRWIRR